MKTNYYAAIMLLAAVFSLPLLTSAASTSTGTATFEKRSYPIKTVQKVSDGYEVIYDFGDPEKYLQSDSIDVYRIQMPDFALVSEAGKPETPFRYDTFAVPRGYSASVSVLSADYVTVKGSVRPASEQKFISETEDVWVQTPIEEFDGFWPAENVSKDRVEKYRGINMVSLQVNPVQYNIKDGTIKIARSLRYKVSLTQSGFAAVNANSQTLTPAIDKDFLSSISENGYDERFFPVEEKNENISDVNVLGFEPNFKDIYLIICTLDYYTQVNRFAEWKRKLGYDVRIAQRMQWTPELVKKTASDLYNANSNFKYLLIFGDTNTVPAKLNPLTNPYYDDNTKIPYDYYSDIYYGCMDGDYDYYPDVFVGRISVETSAQAKTVVDKIIEYEKNPVRDESFYNTVNYVAAWKDVSTSSAGYSISGGDQEYFIQSGEEFKRYLTSLAHNQHPNTFKRLYYTEKKNLPRFYTEYEANKNVAIPIYLQKPFFKWDTGTWTINNAIEAGSAFLIYNSHGDAVTWYDLGYYNHPENCTSTSNEFDVHPNSTKYVDQLQNGNKLPIILSLSCSTGAFNKPTECIAETFLRQNNGGAISVIASSATSTIMSTHSINSKIASYLWPSDVNSYNKLNMGAFCLNIVNGATYYRDFHRLSYHLFGDPGMQIHTVKPTAIVPAITLPNAGTIQNFINIRISESIPDLKISFYNKNTKTSECYAGYNSLRYDFNGASLNDYIITISGANKIPFVIGEAETASVNKVAESVENPKSIIREDLVWEYIDKVHPSAVENYPENPCLLLYYFFRFKGETEINGVTYHNLYSRSANELQEMNRENHADDFDFNSVPDFYVRQEGSKYYMLRNYVSNYEQDMFSGFMGYGSETIESVIYDFSPIPEDSSEGYSYEICTQRLENGEYPDDYNSYLFHADWANPNEVWEYRTFKLPEDLNPDSPDTELLLQKTSLFDAFVDYGAIKGSLGMPGIFHGAGLSCGVYLNKIYTLDGKVKIALPPRYTSDLSGINNVQSDNSGLRVSAEDGRIVIRGAGGNTVRIFSIDGTKVYEGTAENVPVPDKGVYIVRCGSETAKIAL